MTLKTIYQGQVVQVNDQMDSGVIKVRIPTIDQNVADADLAPCYPSFNYQFHRILPKVGERVSIFFEIIYDTDKRINQEKRYWNSVIVADVRNINFDPYYFSSSANQTDGWFLNSRNQDSDSFRGLKLNDDDISLRGRDNTDVIFKPSELLLRSGRHRSENTNIFNDKDQSYIQIKYKKTYPAIKNTNGVEYATRFLPSKHIIILSTNSLEILIKVIDIQTSQITESFSQTYQDEALLYRLTLNKINEFKEKYPQWEFRTADQRFTNLPTLFENAVQVELPAQTEISQIDPSINIVSSKINLLSHGTATKYNLNNQDGLINSEAQNTINDELQRMVRGDNLLDFLELIRTALISHVHPYHNIPICQTDLIKKIISYNLNEIVNDDIRIS
jgi:hypothetical protein